MQETSKLWRALWRAGARVEHRVTIAGAEYGPEKIVSLSTSAALFSGAALDIGSCVSTQLTLELWSAGTIPRNAQIQAFARLTDGTQTSEWLPAGVFFVDTREVSTLNGTIRLQGFDAMLKAEQVFWTGEGGADTWPRKMSAVVATICTRMGVELDIRTELKPYDVEFPNELTMREILGYIAAAHGGCWTITPAGRLRLVLLSSFAAEYDYIADEDGDAITVGGVEILV